ncbi:MAG: HAD-IIIA family hydrolase [Lachnospiraceae bacterium]|nr:HAD-IIIA family hydrolase [Lachnospiraceae bacterium]
MKRPAVFLDRDGVLTVENLKITPPDKTEIFDYAKDCVDRIHQLGYLAIVVTNQEGVAKGIFSMDELTEANKRMTDATGVDDVFVCPHHPDGMVREYTCICDCRKPKPGLIMQAARKYDVDLDRSYMVGDRAGDILAGQNAGIRTVLVDSGYGKARLEQEAEADYYCSDLRDFVFNILTDQTGENK